MKQFISLFCALFCVLFTFAGNLTDYFKWWRAPQDFKPLIDNGNIKIDSVETKIQFLYKIDGSLNTQLDVYGYKVDSTRLEGHIELLGPFVYQGTTYQKGSIYIKRGEVTMITIEKYFRTLKEAWNFMDNVLLSEEKKHKRHFEFYKDKYGISIRDKKSGASADTYNLEENWDSPLQFKVSRILPN